MKVKEEKKKKKEKEKEKEKGVRLGVEGVRGGLEGMLEGFQLSEGKEISFSFIPVSSSSSSSSFSLSFHPSRRLLPGTPTYIYISGFKIEGGKEGNGQGIEGGGEGGRGIWERVTEEKQEIGFFSQENNHFKRGYKQNNPPNSLNILLKKVGGEGGGKGKEREGGEEGEGGDVKWETPFYIPSFTSHLTFLLDHPLPSAPSWEGGEEEEEGKGEREGEEGRPILFRCLEKRGGGGGKGGKGRWEYVSFPPSLVFHFGEKGGVFGGEGDFFVVFPPG